jgi:hypothetical protein
MNNLSLVAALATAPSNAFRELRERPRFLFPLLIVVAASVAVNYWYFSTIDFEWLKQTVVVNTPDFQKMPEGQRAGALAMFTRTTYLWATLIGICLFVPLFAVIQAVFLLVAAKITKVTLGFKHWFAMVCWSMLPALLGAIVSAILLLMSDTRQISPGTMQALSLNELFFHRPMGAPGQGLLDALNIPGFLSWALMIIGVRAWSQRSWGFSAAFVLIPLVAIFGFWAFLAFR